MSISAILNTPSSSEREIVAPISVSIETVEVTEVALETDEYEAFGLWMNIQLSQLVARWKHLAAPNAGTLADSRNRQFGTFD